MSLVRLLAQRIALGLVAAWTVLTAVFAFFTVTDDWLLAGQLGEARFTGAEQEELEQLTREYLAARGLDRPLRIQYVDWMGNMLTLDWGVSFTHGEPALPLVMESVGRTATYVAPAIVIAITVATLVGLYAALNPGSRLANSGVGASYLLFALPNFWVGGILLSYATADVVGYSTLLFEHVLPIVLVTTTLLGGYVSYARAHALEYASADFVTLVTAKGASRLRIAIHVLRNAAIPLFSMVFTEALALLVIAIFVVETLFGISGFGLLMYGAIRARDLPILLGGTIVIIAVGVVGNVVQDLSYSLLDPRVDTGTR